MISGLPALEYARIHNLPIHIEGEDKPLTWQQAESISDEDQALLWLKAKYSVHRVRETLIPQLDPTVLAIADTLPDARTQQVAALARTHSRVALRRDDGAIDWGGGFPEGGTEQ